MRIVNYFYPLTIFAKKLHRKCLGGLKYVLGLHDFFISNAFFQLSLSVLTFEQFEPQMLLISVAYYREKLSCRDTLLFLYLALCLHLGLYMSYLCDLFCHYHFHFYYN